MTRLLVVSAHAADFVWRAGGAIASVTAAGGTAHVVALSYGERGESGGGGAHANVRPGAHAARRAQLGLPVAGLPRPAG